MYCIVLYEELMNYYYVVGMVCIFQGVTQKYGI